MVMDLKQAFVYPYQDKDWIKKCVYLLFSTILFPIAYGYVLRSARNAARNAPLPEWDDIGGLLMDGLRVLALLLGYSLPAFIVIFGSMILGMLGVFGGAAANSSESAGVFALFSSGIMLAGIGLGIVVSLVCSLFSGVAYVILLREDATLGECFDFGRVFKIAMGNIGTLVLFVLFVAIINIIFNIIGEITVIGWIFTVPYGMLVTAALTAQLAHIIAPSVLD